MAKRSKRKAIFSDRDDTVNVGPNCDRAEQFVLLENSREALTILRKAGYLLICVTNQGGLMEDENGKVVGKKPHLTRAELTAIHDKMNNQLGDDAKPDLIKVCPHAFWKYKCSCHKPAPGMLLEAAKELNIDLSKSFMIGDRGSDIKAGHAAGVEPIMVMTGTADAEARTVGDGIKFHKAADLLEAAKYILAKDADKVIKRPARKRRVITPKKRSWYHDVHVPTRKAPVKVLVFDMGHVFVDFDWNEVCKGFCERSGCSTADIKPIMAELSKLGYESGLIGTDAFLAELNRLLKTDISRKEFDHLWTRTFAENVQMAELLQKLREQTKLCLLSNTNEVHYEFLEEKYNVGRHFHHHVLSYKVGSSKPDKPIYEHVVKLTGFQPEEHAFFDDLQGNIDAARHAGWRASLFCSYDQLVKELIEHGFSV